VRQISPTKQLCQVLEGATNFERAQPSIFLEKSVPWDWRWDSSTLGSAAVSALVLAAPATARLARAEPGAGAVGAARRWGRGGWRRWQGVPSRRPAGHSLENPQHRMDEKTGEG